MFALTTALPEATKEPDVLRKVVPAHDSPAVVIFNALVEPVEPPAGASVALLELFPPKSTSEKPELSLLSKLTRTGVTGVGIEAPVAPLNASHLHTKG